MLGGRVDGVVRVTPRVTSLVRSWGCQWGSSFLNIGRTLSSDAGAWRSDIHLRVNEDPLVNEIDGATSVGSVSSLYRRRGGEFDVWAHLAAMNRITALDTGVEHRLTVEPHFAAVERQLHPFWTTLEPREVANVWFCFAQYGRYAKLRFVKRAGARLDALVENYTPRLTSLWLDPSDSSYLPSMFNAMDADTSVASLTYHGGQSIAHAAWGIVRCGVVAPAAMSSICMEAQKPGALDPLTGTSLARLAWAVTESSASSDARDAVAAVMDHVLELGLGNLSLSEAVVLSWAHTVTGTDDPSCVGHAEAIRHVYDRYTSEPVPRDVADFAFQLELRLHALEQAQALSGPALSEPALSEPAFSEPAFSEQALSGSEFGTGALGTQDECESTESHIDAPAIPYHVDDCSSGLRVGYSDAGSGPGSSSMDRSRLFRDFAAELKAMGIRHKVQHNIRGYMVDFAIPRFRIAITFDGVGHTPATSQVSPATDDSAHNVSGASTLPGDTGRDLVMSQEGWKQVNLSYDSWARLGRRAARRAYARDVISNIEAAASEAI